MIMKQGRLSTLLLSGTNALGQLALTATTETLQDNSLTAAHHPATA